MTYPAASGNAGGSRVQPDSGQFWAGAAATALVAALIALVGILICRWTLKIPILAPAGDGAWGNAHTAEYALLAGVIAVIAGGLLYLLVLGTPQPQMFFNWLMGLATVAAVVYPFSTSAPLDQKVATAAVDLVIGAAIGSLLAAVAARAIRTAPPRPRYDGGNGYDGYDRYDDARYQQPVPDQRYRPQRDDGYGREQPQGYGRTRPLNGPQRRDPRRWD